MKFLGSCPLLCSAASLVLIQTASATPPVIFEVNQPLHQVVGLGLPAEFRVGSLPSFFQIQWTLNGQLLPGATNGTLEIPAATYLDSGEYAAVVRNAAGSVTSRVARLNVVPAARIERLGGINSVGWVDSFAIDGSLAYLGISGNSPPPRGGLEIHDVSNPSEPRLVGEYRLPGQGYSGVSDVVVADGRAYLAAGVFGSFRLHVLDISDPSHPLPLGTFATDGSALDLVVRGPMAFVATSRGLEVLDVSDPSAIYRLGAYRTTDAVFTVDLSGSTAYLGATGSGVVILDISDPTSPTLLSSFRSGLESVDTVKADGSRLYASGRTGPFVLDVTHPVFPRLLGNLRRYTDSRGLGRMGSLLIDGGQLNSRGPQSLQIVDASDPTQLAWIGQASTADTLEAVETVGDRIYLAVSSGGFDIFALRPATHAPVVLSPPQAVKVVTGTAAELRVEASGGGPLHFQWSKNGVILEGQTNQSLRLTSASQTDVGEYGVTVGNDAGQIPGGSARLDLIQPPALRLERVQLGDSRGPRLFVTTDEGVQGELFGTRDFQEWQPLWYGQFGAHPLSIFDRQATDAPMRSYRLRLGAR